MMTNARDIMHSGVICVNEYETVSAAATRMRDLGIGALPICADDEHLRGMVTDRDIAVKCLAAGKEPAITLVGELAQGPVYFVPSTASILYMLDVMALHQVRRLPVVEGRRLVGIVTEADVVRKLSEHAIAEFLTAVCAPRAFTA